MINPDGLMMIEPPARRFEPIYDFYTFLAEQALLDAEIDKRRYRGMHQCACGEWSDNRERKVRGMQTNSLLVHYVRDHREDVPPEELKKLEQFLTIYVAASHKARPYARVVADRLSRFTVVSDWFDREQLGYDRPIEGIVADAELDLAQIKASSILVSCTFEPSAGGTHCEEGIAIGMGKRVIVHGPRRHVFHYALPQEESLERICSAVEAEVGFRT